MRMSGSNSTELLLTAVKMPYKTHNFGQNLKQHQYHLLLLLYIIIRFIYYIPLLQKMKRNV